jgi:hypothetical protein
MGRSVAFAGGGATSIGGVDSTADFVLRELVLLPDLEAELPDFEDERALAAGLFAGCSSAPRTGSETAPNTATARNGVNFKQRSKGMATGPGRDWRSTRPDG